LPPAERDGGLAELRRRREQARAEGRLYGIGFAAVVEPAQSNMGYLSTIVPVEERRKAGPKGGNVAYATVHVDCLGAVSVTADSLPQGQGHATILAQIVADQLGLNPHDIRCNMERDTQRDRGRSRPIIRAASLRRRQSLPRLPRPRFAASWRRSQARRSTFRPTRSRSAKARRLPRTIPTTISGSRGWRERMVAGRIADGHGLEFPKRPRTRASARPPNDADQINTSLTYGFVFDFCGVEIDRDTGAVRVDKYVTLHDAGKLLNPLLAEGQVLGSFGWGIGCALFEEFVYSPDGSFMSGTFADYLCPTACEVPRPVILHMESPSPFNPLGAKGIAEGTV
jgi:2-furoyl-CoA dehydrogenase large subunit